MMQDISMHILELIQNSIAAKSSEIDISINDSEKDNRIEICVKDNGNGMDDEHVAHITDPFMTSRSTRKIGMGVPFMKQLSEQCNGSFSIQSKLNEGTTILVQVQRDHIDRPPMGNLGEMMMICIQANEQIDYELKYQTDQHDFYFQSKEVKKELGGISLQESEVLLWIKEYINQQINQLKEDNE